MGFRKAHDPGRKASKASEGTREDPARTGPGAGQAREPREEARARHQEKRQKWANGSRKDPGQGSRPDEEVREDQKRSLASTDWEFKIYHKILLNADTVASNFLEDTSRLSSPFSPPYGAAQLTCSQTVRSNEQMMQSMKGATSLLSGMNRQMNLPALQRIAMEFERENDIMDQRQEMMDDAIDDVTGLEDEEEGEEVVNQVLDEIGVDLKQAVSLFPHHLTNKKAATDLVRWARRHRDCRKTPSRKIELHRRSAAVAEGKTMIFKREWRTFDGEIASRRKNFVLTARRLESGLPASIRHLREVNPCFLLRRCTALGTGFWLASAGRTSGARPSEF
jgi:hypothetical protein